MSSICVSWGFSFAPPEEILEQNKLFLRQETEKIFSLILNKATELENQGLDLVDVYKKIKEIKEYLEQESSQFTMYSVTSGENVRIVNNIIYNINSMVFQIKHTLASMELDLDLKKKVVENTYTKIKEINVNGEDLISENLLNIKKDVEKLMNEKNIMMVADEMQKRLLEAEHLTKASIILKDLNIEKNDGVSVLEYLKKKETEKIDAIKVQIRSISEIIKQLDDLEWHHIKRFVDSVDNETNSERLKLILKELKIKYAKLKDQKILTTLFTEDIENLIKNTENKNIIDKGNEILKKVVISRRDYTKFIEFYYDELNKERQLKELDEYINKIKESFSSLGYSFIEDEKIEALKLHKTVYLDTPLGDEYKIAANLVNNRLTTVFVRILSDEEKIQNLTYYEKIKDVEKAKEWCKDYDKLLNTLKELGVAMKVEGRIEPSPDNIRYESAATVGMKVSNSKGKVKKDVRRGAR